MSSAKDNVSCYPLEYERISNAIDTGHKLQHEVSGSHKIISETNVH